MKENGHHIAKKIGIWCSAVGLASQWTKLKKPIETKPVFEVMVHFLSFTQVKIAATH